MLHLFHAETKIRPHSLVMLATSPLLAAILLSSAAFAVPCTPPTANHSRIEEKSIAYTPKEEGDLQATAALQENGIVYTIDGHLLDSNAEKLDLRWLTEKTVREVVHILPAFTKLKTVDLGTLELDAAELAVKEETLSNASGADDSPTLSAQTLEELSWESILALEQAAPNAQFQYNFTLYGKSFALTDTEMDLNHIKIRDNGMLVRRIIACMPNLNYLDMDFCGVGDEDMAAIRDAFPKVKVVWRIWFGDDYSCRTDVEKILASCPGGGGNLYSYNTTGLKYCTEVKYLDVGHNPEFNDISYLAYMPNLEVAIIAMIDLTDLSPLANCTHLEFLEIQSNSITDLSPLANLTELKHLNIGHNYSLTDITPLYNLTQLERLWIGCMTPIPQDQVDTMRELAPACDINTAVGDPHDGWRYGTERYELLVKQFGYDTLDYTYTWKDPKYYAENG